VPTRVLPLRLAAALAAIIIAFAWAPATAKDVSVVVHVGTNGDGTMYARPASLSATSGDRVTMTVINDDTNPDGSVRTPHDIALEEVDMPRQGGTCAAVSSPPEPDEGEFEVCDQAQASGTFTPSAGTHHYKCEVPGHEANGMKGDLVVATASASPTPPSNTRTPMPGLIPLLAGLALVAAIVRRH
jgi:plastocyanin